MTQALCDLCGAPAAPFRTRDVAVAVSDKITLHVAIGLRLDGRSSDHVVDICPACAVTHVTSAAQTLAPPNAS